MAYIPLPLYTVITLDDYEREQRIYNAPRNVARRQAEQAARDHLMTGAKLFGELPVMPDLTSKTVIPAARVHIKRYPAKPALNSDTFMKRGGTMHGTTQVVTSGNGIGCVPQAFCEPRGRSDAEWLAVRYR